jgi:membrane glycosyltransferase
MLLGLAWGIGVYLLNPSFLPWLLPIVAGLVLSAPVSVLSSRVSLGRWFRRARLFAIPEELAPPVELQATAAHHQAIAVFPRFADTVVDPVLNALACASGKWRNQTGKRDELMQNEVQHGPSVLDEDRRNALLSDPACLSQLHFHVWSSAQALSNWESSK